MLATLAVSAPRSSTASVGKNGRALASTLGGWIRSRESRQLEQKVLRFRGLLASGVLGAVSSTLARLGPLVGTLGFGLGHPPDPTPLLYAAAAMSSLSSGMLGLYLSGRRFVANVMLTVLVFVIVAAASAPLVSIPAAGLWGVK